MLNDQDYELLSAYIDGELPEADRATLEQRLQADAEMRRELDALRATVTMIRGLPPMQVPRNFTLTRNMVQPSRWLIFPTTTAFSVLSAAAAALLMIFGAVLLFNNGSAAMPTANDGQQGVAVVSTQVDDVFTEEIPAQPPQPIDTVSSAPQVAQTTVDQTEQIETASEPNEQASADLTTGSDAFNTDEVSSTFMAYAAIQAVTETPSESPAAETFMQDSQIVYPTQPPPGMGGAGGEAESPEVNAGVAIASSVTGTPGAERNSLTATLILPTETDTQTPSATHTPIPSDTPTATNTPTLPPSPTATATPVPKASAGVDVSTVLPILIFVTGIVLLAIAIITTWVRRRS